ncbi:MAG: MOSC domain-containing protein [Pseudomonadota bacterium]
MSATLSKIVRHPIKAVGRDELPSVALKAGQWMPFDRLWAVSHEKSKLTEDGWARKANFLRGVTDPQLMAVSAKFDPMLKEITLRHPKFDEVTVRPNDPEDTEELVDWLRRIWPDDLPAPTGIYRATNAHLTDVPDPWISINATASLDALSALAGQSLSPHRFRGNLWIDGLDAWQEKGWVGKTLKVGDAALAVREEITRCKATMANPETGKRDVDTLDLLSELGHMEFGVYAEVVDGGDISLGDPVTIAS